jgi:enolase
MPLGAPSFAEALRCGSEIFHTLRGELKKAGHNTNVGDEGGFAPNLPSADAALEFVMAAIGKAGYTAGGDVMLALDCAATEFFKDGNYVYGGENKIRSVSEPNISPISPRAIRSSRSRTACPKTTWTAGSN